MPTLRQDFTYTLRRLSVAPGFVLAVVLSIGIGIATNATIFSIVSRFVLQPPPVGHPATLMSLHTTHDGEECCNNFSWPTYLDMRDQAKSFSGIAAYYELLPASIGGKGEPERAWGQGATANYFDVARLGMTFGRGFLPSEEHQPVIVLGIACGSAALPPIQPSLGNPSSFPVTRIPWSAWHRWASMASTSSSIRSSGFRSVTSSSLPPAFPSATPVATIGSL